MNKIENALQEAGALFEVSKRRIMIDDLSFTHVEDYRLVVNEDDGSQLGVVGSQFGLISHRDAMLWIADGLPTFEERLGPASVRAECFRKLKRGTNAMVTGAECTLLLEFKSSTTPDSDLYPTLRVTHGVAGDRGLKIEAGVFKEVCSNGMITGRKDLTTNLRHTSGIKRRIEHAEHQLHRAVELISSERARHKVLQNTGTWSADAPVEALRYILSGSSKRGKREASGMTSIVESYFTAPGADPGTAFGILQAATHYATHSHGRGLNPMAAGFSPAANAIRARADKLVSAMVEEQSGPAHALHVVEV